MITSFKVEYLKRLIDKERENLSEEDYALIRDILESAARRNIDNIVKNMLESISK